VRIGPAAATESYLSIERIIAAAKASGAKSIHPGYGFLSENADMARACEAQGIIFIGPSVHAIEVMGNKATSKRAMVKAGVPCIPGYQGEDQSDGVLLEAAAGIGFPLMVKAAAGGGGRGMRLVHEQGELQEAIESARSEARNAFGCDELIIEKALIQPRHIEIQVFADSHGNTVQLFERDCSVQRRHQKVIEEAPSPAVDSDLRESMGAAAVSAAASVDYVGAGTVEFLLDRDGAFYFLEMNTRLQVEHPVTEMITGLDLVEWQLRVAAGEPLPLTQDEIPLQGHAIEARLYAEDPSNNFLPASGTAMLWRIPQGQGVRADHGLLENQQVSSFYDPMIAKIICHGKTRDEALRRMELALLDTHILGLPTNKHFLSEAVGHEKFRSGQFSTDFIATNFPEDRLKSLNDCNAEDYALVAILLCELKREDYQKISVGHVSAISRWSNKRDLTTDLLIRIGESVQAVSVFCHAGDGAYYADVDGEKIQLEIHAIEDQTARIEIDGLTESISFIRTSPHGIEIGRQARRLVGEDILLTVGRIESDMDDGAIVAPMHGNILAVNVEEGQQVEKGDSLIVLEAMKMEHNIRAGVSGIVANVSAKPGQQVSANKLLMEILSDQGSPEA